ncbi:hypothetical protein PoB_000825300 [Plakobranchus ocellatus]|uniref:Uncharacterized protein n=1 Tax=Plakobranchus ocellatus TaxID=259542 RepID=A0AAV3YH74_9GAST|nr:hypothetical protein PoB_000825300 [Plakobranchus ocellatus]
MQFTEGQQTSNLQFTPILARTSHTSRFQSQFSPLYSYYDCPAPSSRTSRSPSFPHSDLFCIALLPCTPSGQASPGQPPQRKLISPQQTQIENKLFFDLGLPYFPGAVFNTPFEPWRP